MANQHRPIKVAPRALFAPADGCVYTEEDRKRVFSQQPFNGPELPISYLIPTSTSTLRPPILRYGWRLGHERLMSVIRDCFPSAIKRRHGPPTLGLDDDDLLDLTEESFEHVNDNIADTLYGLDIIIAITAYLGLDWKTEKCIDIKPLPDKDGELEPGLTIGSNYVGLLAEEHIAKLQALFAPNEDPMWYLDGVYWQWYRAPPKAKKTQGTKKTPAGCIRKTAPVA
ncbi:hypothetical protein C8Q76DRAFT_782336 [Earliella scabrosa]|nr:hypothetical protein C8Q76DRAFT_782336 [Earliella scabrosa]